MTCNDVYEMKRWSINVKYFHREVLSLVVLSLHAEIIIKGGNWNVTCTDQCTIVTKNSPVSDPIYPLKIGHFVIYTKKSTVFRNFHTHMSLNHQCYCNEINLKISCNFPAHLKSAYMIGCHSLIP